jgi:hypothetical protein
MTTFALLIFALTALAGIILALEVLNGKLASWPLSLAHASAGALALILLAVEVFTGHGASRTTAALAILVVAAIGGFYLASKHLMKQPAPKLAVVIHAGVAVAGFLTLATTLFHS